MVPPLRLLPNVRSRCIPAARCFSSFAFPSGGRTAPYRRIQDLLGDTSARSTTHTSRIISISSLQLYQSFSPSRNAFSTTSHAYAISFRDLKSDGKAEKPPKQETKEPDSASKEEDPAERAYREATQESAERSREEREQQRKRETEEEAREEASFEGKQDQKERNRKDRTKRDEEPPPPPHGNKSPWTVFKETLSSEFKASSEWNESTKVGLASIVEE